MAFFFSQSKEACLYMAADWLSSFVRGWQEVSCLPEDLVGRGTELNSIERVHQLILETYQQVAFLDCFTTEVIKGSQNAVGDDSAQFIITWTCITCAQTNLLS